MGRYRMLHVKLEADEKVRMLSPPPPNALSLWKWLIAGPLTTIMPGVLPHDDVTMASRLGWQLTPPEDNGKRFRERFPEGFSERFLERYRERFREPFPEWFPEGFPERYPKCFQEAFAQIESLGMAVADWGAPLVYIPNAIRHQGPANPNQVLSWSDTWEDDIPECGLKLLIWEDFRRYFSGRKEGFLEAFERACPRPPGNRSGNGSGNRSGNGSANHCRNQEQEQEQDTGPGEGEEGRPPEASTSAPLADAPGSPACPHEEIVKLYHEMLPELREVKVWNNQRRGWLRARWREDPERQNLDWWADFFRQVRRSDFLMGRVESRNGRSPFEADLEWLVRPTNFAKVIEGKYEDRENGFSQIEADFGHFPG